MMLGWINAPLVPRHFVAPYQGTFSDQMNAHRVSSAMSTPAAAVYMESSVLDGNPFGSSVALLIPLIIDNFNTKTGKAHTRVFVSFAPGINYSIPHGTGICFDFAAHSGSMPEIVYLTDHSIKQAMYFGTATHFIHVKNGPCFDAASKPILESMKKGLKTGRFQHALIISDTPSSASDRARAMAVFRGIDFNYEEIRY